ncbi:hypothetical protein HPDFL43_14982 [Hoeflea phototrophica DFL-43]|jgi:hypothetical protein|uniref:Uncharacterized protein n=1 Tax=Hoeflea phototrophica (strain DSM 17068 / NCIMB 14078 / DFL-43) TaxID=411684 RepID=A9D308_HOEPD|nr:hypothetical protein [Hoeflea phototrophica]EDQ34312.1 hypothetical protein HPDFL43_14982 [Hoeflea phototrophica DFL-43]
MAGERESKLRLTLERMRTEFARGTPAADAHEMARSVFVHNMRDAGDREDRLAVDREAEPPA